MTNTLGAYNPIFYAQETLKIMMQMYGMIGRVNRSYDRERATFNRGEYAYIKRPASLTTQAGGTGTIQDLTTETVAVQLSNYREVKFAVTDKEYAFSGQELIDNHIAPAAYALGNYVNTQLTLLGKYVPWYSPFSSTVVTGDITAGMKVLKDAGGIIAMDTPNIHMATDTTISAALQDLNTFHAANIAGNTNTALVNGRNPGRFGVGDFFDDQTLYSFTSGTVVSAATDLLGALAADGAKGDTTINLGSLSGTETFVQGDTFKIAGNDQQYVVTAATALTAGANAAVPIFPALVQAYSSGAVVTFETKATAYADAYESNLLFHRDAFGLVFGALPDTALNGLGVEVATVTDPVSGMSVRARRAYVDASAKVAVTLDVLFGVKCLNPNYAVVMRRNS